MGVKLVQDDERNTYQSDGAEFYYRRIPEHVENAATKKHTKRGVTNWAAVARDLVIWSLLGWNDKVTLGGKPAEFTPDTIMRLPRELRADLIEAAGANLEQGDEAGEGGGSGN